ncbi:PDZ domain-containing protein [Agarivorans gilvus]|uniref:PDZ domain-containing protein n=1 Tax=Agarivorans gilvus TaxID=680279 RepID=UPI000AFF9D04|nr:PDZ domain-containing protein [Agarivorans gilvus]
MNLAGDLVGINTAIIAPSGGNVGIGFAIPSNMAKVSMQQIIKHGEVKRGQIGVGIQDITPDLRQAFELENGVGGVLVTNVLDDSPADDAGLKAGDIIISVDGQSTKSTGQLRSQISVKAIGESIDLTVIRDGKQRDFEVKVGEPSGISQVDSNIHQLLEGVQLENAEQAEGVRVTQLAPNSAAAYSGLRRNDLIVAVNKRRVKNLDDMQQALQLSDSAVLLQVQRRGGSLFIVIRQ